MGESGRYYEDMDRTVAFQRGLTTWASWVDLNLDQAKTRVFFQSMSPTHYRYYSHTRDSTSPAASLSGRAYACSGTCPVVSFFFIRSVRSSPFISAILCCVCDCALYQLEGMAQPGVEELLRRDGTGDRAQLDRPGLGPGPGDPGRAAGHEEPRPSPRHHGAVGDAEGRAPVGIQRRLLAGAARQPRRRLR
jgi:hypothetical protein